MNIPTLHTKRLILRSFAPDDFESYAAIFGDPEVSRYMGAGEPLSRPQAWRNFAMVLGHWHLRGYGMWAVEDAWTSTLIGRIGLFKPEGWPGLELGWALARNTWGKGFATEGAQRAMDWAFSDLGADRLISIVRPNNVASIGVAERLGMARNGESKMLGTAVLIFGRARNGG